MSIWNQSVMDDSSLEKYVRECLGKGDVGWFPSGVLMDAAISEEFIDLGRDGAKDTLLLEDLAHGDNHHSAGSGHGKHHHGHHHNRGGGGGHGGGGGGGGGHGSVGTIAAPSIHRANSLSSIGKSDEILDRMNIMQRQLQKLAKGMMSSVNSSHAIESSQAKEFESVLEPPSLSASPLITTRRKNLKFSLDPPSAPSTSPGGKEASANDGSAPQPQQQQQQQQEQQQLVKTVESLELGMKAILQRVEEMDKRFTKSHKVIHHRMSKPNRASTASKRPLSATLSKLLNGAKASPIPQTIVVPNEQHPQHSSSSSESREKTVKRGAGEPKDSKEEVAAPIATPSASSDDEDDAEEEEEEGEGEEAGSSESGEEDGAVSAADSNDSEADDIQATPAAKPTRQETPGSSNKQQRPQSAQNRARKTIAVPSKGRPQSAANKLSIASSAQQDTQDPKKNQIPGPPKELVSNLWV